MSAVHLKIDGAIAHIVLDNPAKLNAFTPQMLVQLETHCATLEQSLVEIDGGLPKTMLPEIRALDQVVRADALHFALDI